MVPELRATFDSVTAAVPYLRAAVDRGTIEKCCGIDMIYEDFPIFLVDLLLTVQLKPMALSFSILSSVMAEALPSIFFL